jgi:hypothetical protein
VDSGNLQFLPSDLFTTWQTCAQNRSRLFVENIGERANMPVIPKASQWNFENGLANRCERRRASPNPRYSQCKAVTLLPLAFVAKKRRSGEREVDLRSSGIFLPIHPQGAAAK